MYAIVALFDTLACVCMEVVVAAKGKKKKGRSSGGGIIAFTDDGLFQAWRSNLSDEYKRIVDEAERTVGEYLGEEMTILTFPDTRPYARGGHENGSNERPSGILARIRAWWARA